MTTPKYKLIDDIKESIIYTGSICNSRSPKVLAFLEQNPHLIDWRFLSQNPAAIGILEKNLDKIDWINFSSNPSGTSLLETNFDKIDFNWLSSNEGAKSLLERISPELLDWESLVSNPAASEILKSDYNRLKETLRVTNPMFVSEDEFEDEANQELYTLDPAIINSFPYNINWSRLCQDEKNLPLLEDYIFYLKRQPYWETIAMLNTKPWAVDFLYRNDLINWNYISANSAAVHIIRKHPSEVQDLIILNPNPEVKDIKESVKSRLTRDELKQVYSFKYYKEFDFDIEILREGWPYTLEYAYENSRGNKVYLFPNCIFKYPEFYEDILKFFDTHWSSIRRNFVLKSYFHPCYVEIVKKYPSVLCVFSDYDLLIEEVK